MTIHYSPSHLFGLNAGGNEAWWRKCARVVIIALIGTTLLLAGIGKLLDNRRFAQILSQWQLFPAWSLLALGVLLSLSELLLALWLFSGWRLASAALLGVLFHVAYVIGTLVTVLRGIRLPDCGCFGIFFPHPLDWVMVFEDSASGLLCLGLYLLARRKPTRRGVSRQT
jgi:hypothetical protein